MFHSYRMYFDYPLLPSYFVERQQDKCIISWRLIHIIDRNITWHSRKIKKKTSDASY